MRKKQACPIMAVLLVLAACLAGCTEAREKPEGSTEKIAPTVTNGNPAESAAMSAAGNTEPQRFVETVNEHFQIDADVIGCPADGMAAVYSGERCVFTMDNIQALIDLSGGHIISSREWEEGSLQCFAADSDNGYHLVYEHDIEGVSNTPYSLLSYHNKEYFKMYAEYPIYSSEYSYETNAKYTVGWMFTEPKDFAFASAEEAEAATRQALETLGLSQLVLLRTLYIDHNTLAEAAQLVTTDDTYAPVGEPRENNGFTLRDGWSEADDAYVFSYSISVDGSPMTYRDDLRDTGVYCGVNIIVWYNEKGIIELRVTTPWVVGAEENGPASIVPAQAALDTAKEKYQYVLHSDIAINKIYFEYQHVQVKSRRQLRPVWAVAITMPDRGLGETFFDFVYIDALTGREI